MGMNDSNKITNMHGNAATPFGSKVNERLVTQIEEMLRLAKSGMAHSACVSMLAHSQTRPYQYFMCVEEGHDSIAMKGVIAEMTESYSRAMA